MIPARTSPEPETPARPRRFVPPELAVGRRDPRRDPAQPDHALGPAGQVEAAPAGSSSTSSSSTCSAKAISVGFSVSTRPSRWCRASVVRGDAGQPRARRGPADRSGGEQRSPKSWVASVSAMPGPMRTASASPPGADGVRGSPGRARRPRSPAGPDKGLGHACAAKRGHRGDRGHLQLSGPRAGPPPRRGGRRRGSRRSPRSPGSSRGRSCHRPDRAAASPAASPR